MLAEEFPFTGMLFIFTNYERVNMMELKNLIAVTGNSGNILGKLLYFSLGNILIEKDAFEEAGIKLGLPKIKPQRESPVDAFNSATGDIRDRKVIKNGIKKLIKIYVRDNEIDVSEPNIKSRELVLEELGFTENRYRKIAGLYYDRENDIISYDINAYGYYNIDPEAYCRKAEELFNLYRRCYGRGSVETVIYSYLNIMEAIKISVHGFLFFIPRHNVHMVDILEDYIEELNSRNLNNGNCININSIWVTDDEKQRKKMEDEFYLTVEKELELYQERLQYFLATGSQSEKVIPRWIEKINTLKAKKARYEDLFRNKLDKLSEEFEVLELQQQELQIRLMKSARGGISA